MKKIGVRIWKLIEEEEQERSSSSSLAEARRRHHLHCQYLASDSKPMATIVSISTERERIKRKILICLGLCAKDQVLKILT